MGNTSSTPSERTAAARNSRMWWPTETAYALLHPEGEVDGYNYHKDEVAHADLEARAILLRQIEPIWMECEGSRQPLIDVGTLWGTCTVCGHGMIHHNKGDDIAWRHDRPDVMEMMRRGDFRRIWPHDGR